MKLIYSWLGACFLCVLTCGSAWLFFSPSAVAKRAAAYDLAVKLTPAHDRVTSGGQVYFLVSVANRSGDSVNDVLLNFTLPTGLTHLSCLPEFGICGGAGNQRTVTIATLNAGQTRAATFVAMVNNPTSNGAVLMAQATVEPTTMDTDRSNNNASASVTVVAAEDVVRRKANGRIVFASNRAFSDSTEPTGLYTAQADGTGEAVITSTIGEAYRPVWSPDGTTIVYAAYNDNAQGDALYLIKADGSGKRKIAVNALGRQGNHVWAPNGQQVIYVGDDRTLFLAQADGSGSTRLPNSPGQVGDVDWSPDGTQLAIERLGEIWLLMPDGLLQRRITGAIQIGERFSQPRWSPDGTRLLFQAATTNRTDVYLANADGSGVTRAFNTLSSGSPAWSPDGARIVFTATNGLFVINFDGTQQTRLTNNRFYNFSPHWQPILTTPPPPPPPPDSPTITISGKVINEEGRPYGALMRITGNGIDATVQPDEPNGPNDGRYRFVRLPRGGTYTITPQNLAFRFEPPSRIYTNVISDISSADFQAFFRPLAIRGRITDSAGLPMAGVSFVFGSNYSPVETDENGRYAFTNLTGGGNYNLTPLGYASNELFEPRSAQFEQLAEDKTVNFVGQRELFEVSGQVLDGAGQPVSGVTVTLNGTQPNNNVNRTVTTNAAGQFSFTSVTGGFAYVLKASKGEMSFAPAERRVIVNRPTEVNFYSGATSAAAVSAASYRATDITLGGIVSVFGTGLATTTKAAGNQPLPTELEGVTATVIGRNLNRPCQLFFVSPQQINLLLPQIEFFLPQPTEALLTIHRNGLVVAAASLPIRAFAPALFTANANGQGVAAAVALRVKADGTQVYESISRLDTTSNRFVATPIEVSNPAEQVFLILFGTGIGYRPYFRTDLLAQVGGQNCEITFAGPQGSLVGIDQVNVRLPQNLAGRGEVEIVLTTREGAMANPVRINLK